MDIKFKVGDVEQGVKPCKHCGTEKPLTDYPRDTSKGLQYRRPVCKACASSRDRPQRVEATWPQWMTKR